MLKKGITQEKLYPRDEIDALSHSTEMLQIDSATSSKQMAAQKIPVVQNNINNNASTAISCAKPMDPPCDHLNDEANKTNLIINYLPQNMTQEEIRSLFASLGEVESCKLIRDKQTGQSLGYGFVNYKNQDDAAKAIANLNGLRLQNKIIKVSYARPSSESIKGANLYICGLPKSMTQPELEELFQQCGHIITSRILYDNSTGLSKGVGFIRFDRKYEAELAIEKLNGYVPQGHTEKVTVKFANNPSNKNNSSITMALAASVLSPARHMIGPIHAAGRFGQLYRYSPFDTTSLMTGTIPQAPNPYAFAAPALATAPAALPTVSTASVTPQPLQSNSPVNQGWAIFIRNLPPDAEDRILWELFGPYGAVIKVNVIKDFESQKCKGFGFVTMADYQEASMAINALHGMTFHDRPLEVRFKQGSNTKKIYPANCM